MGFLDAWLMQFLTGIYLSAGLTWFNVFSKAAPLYMAGLAFTAYPVHRLAMAGRQTSVLDGWVF
jgi:hypothetical protein